MIVTPAHGLIWTNDGFVLVHGLDDGATRTVVLEAAGERPYRVRPTTDGRRVCGVLPDGRLMYWALGSNECAQVADSVDRRITDGLRLEQPDLITQGDSFVSLSCGGELLCGDLGGAKALARPPDGRVFESVVESADGEVFAATDGVASSPLGVRLEVRDGRTLVLRRAFQLRTMGLHLLAADGGRRRLYVLEHESLLILDTLSGAVTGDLGKWGSDVVDLLPSADGRHLFLAMRSGPLILLDIN